MLLQEMDVQECKELLTHLGSGRLACARNNQPYVIPIYFAVSNDMIYSFATCGKKIEWMRENPLVCLEVDQVRSQNYWDSVIVLGKFEEIPDQPEFALERNQAQMVLDQRALWWQTAYASSQPRTEHKPPEPIFFRVRIDEITGHKARPDAIETTFSGGKLGKKVAALEGSQK
jgi:nitroimidazol reductase NimA-like FMN-containing flavoprotein (pyridoxamine 5'-phosphate oxidase superfamily)